MQIRELPKIAAAVVISELAGVIGAVFTTPAIPVWYAGLVKPALNPPAWVFAPVWTVLYFLMGVAAYLVWRKGWRRMSVKVALGVFAGQLIELGRADARARHEELCAFFAAAEDPATA